MQSKNYIIDGDADGVIEGNFFTELKNMLNHSEAHEDDNTNNDNAENENEDNCCLLTKEPLQNIHIVLSCGHKFNYIPLYREVIAQKTIGISTEADNKPINFKSYPLIVPSKSTELRIISPAPAFANP